MYQGVVLNPESRFCATPRTSGWLLTRFCCFCRFLLLSLTRNYFCFRPTGAFTRRERASSSGGYFWKQNKKNMSNQGVMMIFLSDQKMGLLCSISRRNVLFLLEGEQKIESKVKFRLVKLEVKTMGQKL